MKEFSLLWGLSVFVLFYLLRSTLYSTFILQEWVSEYFYNNTLTSNDTLIQRVLCTVVARAVLRPTASTSLPPNPALNPNPLSLSLNPLSPSLLFSLLQPPIHHHFSFIVLDHLTTVVLCGLASEGYFIIHLH